MPIYEYRCEDCQQVFEEWCKHVEDEQVPHPCPICKGKGHRLISNTSFALKGGGWYATEYGSHKQQPSDSGKTASTSETKCSAGADTPATCPASAEAGSS